MMSLILATTARGLMPLLLLFSLHLLWRGHHEPGGGFIAGLMTAAALVLQYIAFNAAHVRKCLPVDYRVLIGTGLACSLSTGLMALIYGSAFLEHRFGHFHVLGIGEVELATALAFDIGVYLTVIGVTLLIIATLGDESEAA
ncbi:MAG: Na(+)/H(+) antiporter subunit B [Verrucomicrobiae bacterium]|nr:Na(+)/H(+) antiporter subunit B [Verrucomicrobiae bacterium]